MRVSSAVAVCFLRSSLSIKMVLQNDIDLLHPPAELEKRKHKLKRLVQSPNSFFMDVKCQGCFNITTVFSHSQTVVVCGNCQTVLCSLLVGVPGSPRVALSGGRGTDALPRTLLTLISLSTREPLKVDFMEEKKWCCCYCQVI
ncbi:ribosomal protein S27 [Prunus dulcis]|uniref:Ribosomal protein S27 n=1 Tax=Prunus dulcis TaxID=3755 RepID=A0A4Y1QPM0_PRUDU|nr:ribosomal protein S27 [Prunus dulcis]